MEKITIQFEAIVERSIPELQDLRTITKEQAKILANHLDEVDECEVWLDGECLIGLTYFEAAKMIDCESGFEDECLQHVIQELYPEKYICEY